jgi:hypothetical protein
MTPPESKVVETITNHPLITESELHEAHQEIDEPRLRSVLQTLENEGEVVKKNGGYQATIEAEEEISHPTAKRNSIIVVIFGLVLIGTIVYFGLSSYQR